MMISEAKRADSKATMRKAVKVNNDRVLSRHQSLVSMIKFNKKAHECEHRQDAKGDKESQKYLRFS